MKHSKKKIKKKLNHFLNNLISNIFLSSFLSFFLSYLYFILFLILISSPFYYRFIHNLNHSFFFQTPSLTIVSTSLHRPIWQNKLFLNDKNHKIVDFRQYSMFFFPFYKTKLLWLILSFQMFQMFLFNLQLFFFENSTKFFFLKNCISPVFCIIFT